MSGITTQHVDVLIIGAGFSGIVAACTLQSRCPEKTFAILEARDAAGGTWDLFRYPGIRSDSDLYTMGFSFRPWTGDKSIADGDSILRYLHETIDAHGIGNKIRFGHRVVGADWRSSEACWAIDVKIGPANEAARFTCKFLSICTGYYDYGEGYLPQWPGTERFKGRFVHPQAWPEDLETAGKRIVVIGSGATAVTLVPELAKTAHVTMLQRSPSYIVALPSKDRIADWLRARLPEHLAHGLARWKNVLIGLGFYQLARRKPEAMARRLVAGVRRQLGPDYDVAKHFTPHYKPWDQRLCLAPNGDLFRAIRDGRATVETETIDTFTETGVQLASGKHLEADIVVAATGLKLKLLGGLSLTVDGTAITPEGTHLYRGMMLSDVPNLAIMIGYTNASWTLKCELTARYMCRLIRHMDRRGYDWCVPRRNGTEGETESITFTSGYIERSRHLLPKQGLRTPWRLHQNYVLDLATLRFARIEDGALMFGRSPTRKAA